MCNLRRNAYSSNTDSHLATSSLGLNHLDDISLDEWGQVAKEGIGQGAPCDENGCYLYSQIEMLVVPSPPTPSPSCLDTINEVVLVFNEY